MTVPPEEHADPIEAARTYIRAQQAGPGQARPAEDWPELLGHAAVLLRALDSLDVAETLAMRPSWPAELAARIVAARAVSADFARALWENGNGTRPDWLCWAVRQQHALAGIIDALDTGAAITGAAPVSVPRLVVLPESAARVVRDALTVAAEYREFRASQTCADCAELDDDGELCERHEADVSWCGRYDGVSRRIERLLP
jgi:hypothetical protein